MCQHTQTTARNELGRSQDSDDASALLSVCSGTTTSSQPTPGSSATSSLGCLQLSWEEEEVEVDGLLRQQEEQSLTSRQYVKHLYAGSVPAATMRSSVVDWMVNASMDLQLSNDAVFLAVQLFDKFLQHLKVQEGTQAVAAYSQPCKLHLAAITTLWVAAKYEGAAVPTASAFLQQLASSNHQQLLSAEAELLTALDHRLTCPTPKSFLRRYLLRVDVGRQLYFTAGYLAELSLLDAGMLCYKPSMVAASSYAWALVLTGSSCNDDHMLQLTGYSMQDIMPCVLRLARVHSAACNTFEPCVISRKYLAEDLAQVSALPPISHKRVVELGEQYMADSTLTGRASQYE